MRRTIACCLVLGVLATLAVTPAAAAARSVTTYTTVNCWIGWTDPYWRPTGRDGQVEHDGAVITWEVWIYDAAGGWRSVGTEVDTVMDESNAFAGTELFRGSFVLNSTLGNFAGSFVWTESPSRVRGHGVGRAIDGSGLLWKYTPNVVDPATTGTPACATPEPGVPYLGLLEIVAP